MAVVITFIREAAPTLLRRNEINSEAGKRDNRAIDNRKTCISWRPFFPRRTAPLASPPTWHRSSGELLYRLPVKARRSREDLLPRISATGCEGNERKLSSQCLKPWNQDVRAHGCTNRSSFAAAINVPKECTAWHFLLSFSSLVSFELIFPPQKSDWVSSLFAAF